MRTILFLQLTVFLFSAVDATQSGNCLGSGKPPVKRRRSLGPCAKFEKQTCCNSTAPTPADVLTKVKAVVEANDLSESCRNYFLDMACMKCDPRVGMGLTDGICSSFCKDWFRVCKDDFFIKHDAMGLRPCSNQDVVCAKLDTIVENATEFCADWMGVPLSETRKACFDGSPPRKEGVKEAASWASSNLLDRQTYLLILNLLTWICTFTIAKQKYTLEL